MPASTLSLTVKTIDEQVLLPAGNELSSRTLDDLISSNDPSKHRSYPLMRFGTVKKDLLDFISVPPYRTIFSIEEELTEALNVMETVFLHESLLQTLNYFKEHDHYSYRHFLVVFALSTLLAEDLVLDHKERLNTAKTGPIHDIGKGCVPMEILKKTTPLTRYEKKILNEHTAAGYVLLSYYLQNSQALASCVARDHHEREDGSGYPRGIQLRDSRIELIVACDVYDALISPRPYRQTAYDNRSALEVISVMAEEKKLQWNVVKALVGHNRESKTHFSKTSMPNTKRGHAPEDSMYGVIID